MRPSVASRMKEIEKYKPEENEILRSIAGKLITFEEATPNEDAPRQYFSDGGSYITIKVSDMARSGCIVACNDVVRDYLFSLIE